MAATFVAFLLGAALVFAADFLISLDLPFFPPFLEALAILASSFLILTAFFSLEDFLAAWPDTGFFSASISAST